MPAGPPTATSPPPRCVFGHGKAVAGQGGASSGMGIQRVRLALAAPCGPVGAADLCHLDSGGLQNPSQARTVTGGAFHAGDHNGPKPFGPSDPIVVACWVRRELGVRQGLPGIGNDSQMVGVRMGVGADDDAP